MRLTATLIWLTVFGLIIGCSSNNSSETPNEDMSTVPDHIREVDSLTVYSTDAEPAMDIEFKRETTFTDDVGIGTMGNMAVDEQGRVFVAEGGFLQKRQMIHVFNPDGSYLTGMGRSGKGPGEFQSISGIHIHSGYLFAYDNQLQRINIFSLGSFTHHRTVILNPQSWDSIEELDGSRSDPVNHYIRNDSTVLFGFTEPLSPGNPNDRYRRYYLMDWEGNIISGKVFEEKDVNFYSGPGVPGPQLTASPTLTFDRSALIAVSDDGYIYSAWTEDFLVKVNDPNGQYLRAFYYPYKKSAMIRDDILDRYGDRSRQFQQGIRNKEFPETWPALHYMLMDDKNRLWISTITDDEKMYDWWVLDEYGKLLARFKWPGKRLYRDTEERPIKLIKNGYLYAVETEEPWVQKIVRYRIEMK